MTKDKAEKFAVIKSGGKQYLVREGDRIRLEKISDDLKEGDKISFDEVLLKVDKDKFELGKPTVAGAKVEAQFVKNGRAKKISVIRFRPKSRYFKNKGHRQHYSEVVISKI